MKLEIFECNPFSENSYLVWDKDSGDAMLLDPGFLSPEEEQQILDKLAQEKLRLRYVINTHCHLDHIFGNAFLKLNFPDALLLIPKNDLPLLKQGKDQSKLFGIESVQSPMPDGFLDEYSSITLGKLEFSLLYTPGHTPGEFSLYNADYKICFTGDVLFRGSIGRTDLWGGNLQTLLLSIKNELFTLPGDVVVYPGHGIQTTIGYEKTNNPFFF